MREEKQKKEEEEKEAQKRAEEEERRRREEEEEARRKAEEEEQERRRLEEEEARRKAEEEKSRRIAEEAEAARKAQEAEKTLSSEPQTREDPDIELVTEEMLDDNLPVQETEDGKVNTSSHTDDEQAKDEELEDGELDLETNGTLAEAGPQLDEREEDEDLEIQTLGESDSKPVQPSDEVTSDAHRPTSPGEELDRQATSDTSAPSNAEQKRVRAPAISKGPSSRSQEKREQRRRRGLEHNQRETERASSALSKDETSPPKSKNQESSKLKERADSKELDQYTFVAWKMKEDKGGKKDAKASPGPVRPSTLALQPADAAPERNGHGESGGAVNLQRRPGAIKEKPEKWRGWRSEGEHSEGTSPPHSHNREERRNKQPL